MSKLEVTYRKVADLIPYARNARTHSPEQVARIAGSIKEFGWTAPILVDGENGIIAGHGRLAAAQKLKMTEVPCIELSGLTDTQRRAYILADNKLALDAGWDEDILKVELDDLKIEGVDLDAIGFSEEEINDVLGDGGEESGEGGDEKNSSGSLAEKFGAPPPVSNTFRSTGVAGQKARMDRYRSPKRKGARQRPYLFKVRPAAV